MAREQSFVTRSSTADTANRDPDDFYPTPPQATHALLKVESFRGRIWEPACGDGAISKVLEEAGHRVFSFDLHPRGYGQTGPEWDFLRPGDWTQVSNIITNPPFRLSEDFLHRALPLASRKVVLLNRLAWLEGRGRHNTVYGGRTPLARVWVFSSRLHFLRSGDVNNAGGGGMVAYAWYVWDHDHTGPTELHHLPPFEKESK